ncbi:hypothetical protein DIE19_05975 [Burkholderia sp. Bp9126]|nr:hypothetical protein DIE19_05975 [Burkholderia sp. Bp9126]
MNKSYKTIWNEALGAWVAASELVGACGKSSRSSTRGGVAEQAFGLRPVGLLVLAAMGFASSIDVAMAGGIASCTGVSAGAAYATSSGGAWAAATWNANEGNCGTGTGVIISENPSANGGVSGTNAYIWVGKTGTTQ